MIEMGIFDFLFNSKKDNPEKKKGQDFIENPQNNNNNHDLLPEGDQSNAGINFLKVIEEHWGDISATELEAATIIATPADDILLESSKLGHYPYMPLDFNYPKDLEGNFMYPLAQINFSEAPPLDGFPTSGYLQFYITYNDRNYGMFLDNLQSQDDFRILFFEEDEIIQHKADFSFLDKIIKSDQVPVLKPHILSFSTKKEYIGVGDVRTKKGDGWMIEQIADKHPGQENNLINDISEVFETYRHKIGGYAAFCESDDPRIEHPEFAEYILLLQIVSHAEDIHWKEYGVGHFFIHPEDLLKKDFSRVVYSWDSSY
jgi:uncharacterized protein YwqG